MTDIEQIGIILGFVWGIVWAVLLQSTDWGQFLAARRAWLAVVIGVGADLLILVAVLPLPAWLLACAVIGASSVGIVIRSIANEWRDHREQLEAAAHGHTDPDR